MIDLTNIKAPGWGRIVAELSATAPDDRAFLERLLVVIAQVSAARQAALFLAERREGDEIEPRLTSLWPTLPAPEGQAPAPPSDASLEQPSETLDAARAALSSGQSRAFGLEQQTQYYDSAPGKGFLLAIPLHTQGAAGPSAAGAITLLIESRSRDAIRSTLAMAEVLAGYVNAHSARQALRRTQQASFALDLATRLISSINTAPSFKGAAIQLCNDVAKQFSVDRVALGWARGRELDTIRVEAISDTEHFDRRTAMVQRLTAAMEECLDQEQPVLFPQPAADTDVLLSQAIVHAHRELAAGDAKLRVCSLPLRVDEQLVGVVTVESSGDTPIDLATIELLQAAMDLIAPVMRIRRSDDRHLPGRAWDSLLRSAAWAVGPRHTAWKVTAALLIAGSVFITFYKTTYRVGAEAVLEPATRRIVSSPLDGVILSIGLDRDGQPIEPGAIVQAGDLLLELDSTEWKLSAADARGKMIQAELQESAALRENDSGKAAQARAQAQRARAELGVYEYRIERARITAPISGTILGGKLKDRVGGAVKLGDALLEVAPLGEMVVTARVDDRDISLIKDAHQRALIAGEGAAGEIATKSLPGHAFPFIVERIVPLAEAKDGRNVFEVRARLLRSAEWMRPGMEGRAKFDTERRSLLWIGTRRIIDAVRIWWW